MGGYNEGFRVIMRGFNGGSNEGFQWAVIMRGFNGQF